MMFITSILLVLLCLYTMNVLFYPNYTIFFISCGCLSVLMLQFLLDSHSATPGFSMNQTSIYTYWTEDVKCLHYLNLTFSVYSFSDT